jgi:hypothetical protein
MKTSLGECCREYNIRTTNRGMIAGQNLDVNVVCGVLHSLGILVPDNNSSDPTSFYDTPSSSGANGGTSSSAVNHMKTSLAIHRLRSQYFHSSPSFFSNPTSSAPPTTAVINLSAEEVLAKELVLVGHHPSLQGFLRSFESKYKSQLIKYYEEIRSTTRQLASSSSAGATTSQPGASDTHPPPSAPSPSASAASILMGGGGSGKIFLPDQSNAKLISYPNLPPLPSSILSATSSSTSALKPSYPHPPLIAPSSTTLTSGGALGTQPALAVVAPVVAQAVGAPVKAHQPIHRRSNNQRYWKISSNISLVIPSIWQPSITAAATASSAGNQRPGNLLQEYMKVIYEEQVAQEQEEMILRKLAGQLSIPLSTSRYRHGTSYLLASSSSSHPPAITAAVTASAQPLTRTTGGPTTTGGPDPSEISIRTGHQYTGFQLREKVKPYLHHHHHKLLHSQSQKRSSLYNKSSPFLLSSASSTGGASSSSASRSHHHQSFSFPKEGTKNLPLNLYSDPYLSSSKASTNRTDMLLTGSLYASTAPMMNSASSSSTPGGNLSPMFHHYDATMIRPDLVIRTAEIPWHMIANEFMVQEDQVETTAACMSSHHSSTSLFMPAAAVIGSNSKSIAKQKSITASASRNNSLNTTTSSKNSQSNGKKSSSAAAESSEHSSSFDSSSNGNHHYVIRQQADVLAPAYHSIEDDESMEEDENEVEDISDEAMIYRHDRVLQRMRDNYLLLQRLRLELRHGILFDAAGRVKPGITVPPVLLHRHNLTMTNSSDNAAIDDGNQASQDSNGHHHHLNSNNKKRSLLKSRSTSISSVTSSMDGYDVNGSNGGQFYPRKRGRPSKQAKLYYHQAAYTVSSALLPSSNDLPATAAAIALTVAAEITTEAGDGSGGEIADEVMVNGMKSSHHSNGVVIDMENGIEYHHLHDEEENHSSGDTSHEQHHPEDKLSL